MKKLLFPVYLLLFCLSGITASGQTLSTQVVNSSGMSFSQNNITLEFSLGELSISEFKSAGVSLTEGLLQPSSSNILRVDHLDTERLEIYPNPCRDLIYLKGDFNDATAEIFTIYGAQILSVSNLNAPVNLSSLAAGLYFFKFTFHDHTTKVVKIEKTN